MQNHLEHIAPVSFDVDPFQFFASVTALLTILFVLTVPSLGVPIFRTSPYAMMKSMLSELDRVPLEGTNVICEPDTVNESCGK